MIVIVCNWFSLVWCVLFVGFGCVVWEWLGFFRVC